MSPENQRALDTWNMIQAVGPEMTMRLIDIKLTKREAEDLLWKLTTINQTIRQFEAEKNEE